MATGVAVAGLLLSAGGAVQQQQSAKSEKNRAEDAVKEADRDAEDAKQAAIDADAKAATDAESKRKDRIRKLKGQGKASTRPDDFKPTSGKTILGG